MNETIKLGLTLMIVSLIAAAALAVTNYYTAPKIEGQNKLLIKGSLNKVMPAASFQEKDGYYEAYDKDGGLIGKVLKVVSPGYSSTISALVGIDLWNAVTGVDIVSQQETPGLGANIEKDEFLKQFIGLNKNEIKIKKDGGIIDAVTGATISSRAITNGIRDAIESNLFEKDSVIIVSPEANYTAIINITDETVANETGNDKIITNKTNNDKNETAG